MKLSFDIIAIKRHKIIENRKPSTGNLYNSLPGKLSRDAKWFKIKEKPVDRIAILIQGHAVLMINLCHTVFTVFLAGCLVFIN